MDAGPGLNGFAGQALYIGPTLYATFGERYFVSAAWNVQVWGGIAGSSGALDLDHFERHAQLNHWSPTRIRGCGLLHLTAMGG